MASMVFSWNWSERPADLSVSVFAHRALAGGHAIRLTKEGYAGPEALAAAAERCSLPGSLAHLDHGASFATAPLKLPRIVVYTGTCIGYPYYAYYSHALWSLGLTYRRASAEHIAQGQLADADLLIIPGGFATWGLDRIEGTAGVDQAIREFIARGGACIASCGGAFYLSEGRPGWLNAIDAKPRFTHEYLLTGTCLLNVRLSDPALRRDLPESLELPYYHGPVYEMLERHSPVLGTFGEHVLANRLFINNPINAERYGNIMQGRGAIMAGRTPQHRVIGFSAHPEMGEFLRKAMVLDSYVRHYLPLRGAKTMQETLRFYGKEDCIAFRLILNAAIMLGAFSQESVSGSDASVSAKASAEAGSNDRRRDNTLDIVTVWRDGMAHLRSRLALDETPGIAALMEIALSTLEDEWNHVLPLLQVSPIDEELHEVLNDAAAAIVAASPLSCIENMVLLELAVRLATARARISRFDSILETA